MANSGHGACNGIGSDPTSDKKRKAEKRREAMLLEGLSSAETELTQADWGDIRKEALAKVAATAATASMPKQAAVKRL